jgi:6-phosphofructokinase 2
MPSSIVTLTLSPTVDMATEVARVEPDRKLRCGPPRFEPGGGGVNVAKVVTTLGGTTVAVVAAGGPFGRILTDLLHDAPFETDIVAVAGQTRESVAVTDQSTNRQYRFVLPGPSLTSLEWDACLAAVRVHIDVMEVLVVSGSIPDGVPEDVFVALAAELTPRHVPIVVDTSGPALLAAIDAPVALVKPSVNELRLAAGRELHDVIDYVQSARTLLRAGKCDAAIVSMGPVGALLVRREGPASLANAPAVRVVSTIGAGDSMVGAVSLALARGRSFEDALGDGVAAGTAAVTTPGTELCECRTVESLRPHVTVKTLEM